MLHKTSGLPQRSQYATLTPIAARDIAKCRTQIEMINIVGNNFSYFIINFRLEVVGLGLKIPHLTSLNVKTFIPLHESLRLLPEPEDAGGGRGRSNRFPTS